MDTLYSNFDQDLFSSKREEDINKYTNLSLSNTFDKTITNFKKLTITIPNTENNNYTNNSSFNVINVPEVCKNNKEVIDDERNGKTLNNHINTCRNIKINPVVTNVDSKKNLPRVTINKKQRNVSFSNEKLWEINRVNHILHKKISNEVKPTYLRQKPSTSFVKATSTINRERKNKDIIKGNEILAKKLKNIRSTISK